MLKQLNNIEAMELEKTEAELIQKILDLVEAAKARVATTINAELSVLYWTIGEHINATILQNERAVYGKEIIKKLAESLTVAYGKGWSDKQLRHCMQFATVFPDSGIVYTLCRQFSWSHIRIFIYIENPLKRDFYIEMCKLEHWSVRGLKERMNSLLYERTAISQKPDETIKNELTKLKNEQKISPDLVFRDPYVLDFLGLKDTYSEQDLENAILAELQRFIIEMGTDFAFLARQKRITIDQRDYYIDLLFYHRRLKALIVIDLKIGEFEAAFKGQMELYLRYLEKYDMVEGENPPIGLILCTGKNEEHVEILQLDKSNIKVAEYLTQLPSRKLLMEKLHLAIEIAKNRGGG